MTRRRHDFSKALVDPKPEEAQIESFEKRMPKTALCRDVESDAEDTAHDVPTKDVKDEGSDTDRPRGRSG